MIRNNDTKMIIIKIERELQMFVIFYLICFYYNLHFMGKNLLNGIVTKKEKKTKVKFGCRAMEIKRIFCCD